MELPGAISYGRALMTARPVRAKPEPKRASPSERPSRSGEVRARGDAVVRAVIDATIDELARVGFAALAIEAVAERAGVNKTTVYRRFPTKVDLVVAAFLTEKGQLALDAVDTGALRSDLVAMLTAGTRFMSSPRGKSLFRTLLGDRQNPEVAGLAERLRRDGERTPVLVLQRAIARGELAPETDLQLLLQCFFGAIMHRVFLEERELSLGEIETLVDMVLHGVLVDGPRRPKRSASR